MVLKKGLTRDQVDTCSIEKFVECKVSGEYVPLSKCKMCPRFVGHDGHWSIFCLKDLE